MLIPLGTDRPLRRPTLATYALIAANVAVFAAHALLQAADRPEAQDMMVWGRAWRLDFRWWTLITACFLHVGFWHIGGNMLFLWVFGPNIEDRLGRAAFVLFYVAGGAAAMGLHVLFVRAPVVGASGSIAALTGAYLVMFPRTLVKVFFLLTLSVIQVAAGWFILAAMAWDAYAGGIGGGRTGVAHVAHLGGYAFGAGVAFVLLALKVIPGEACDLLNQTRQAYRRRKFRTAEADFNRRIEKQLSPAGAAENGKSDPVTEARSNIARLVAAGDLAGGAEAYRALANAYGHMPRAAVLSRRPQYELANHFYQTGDYQSAAYAYERFLEAYATDRESPEIRLLLGRINARYLNDPVRAKALLNEAMGGLRDDSTKQLARQELEGLG